MNAEYQKGNELSGLGAEQPKEKFPSFRFSEEISYMVTVLEKRLSKLPYLNPKQQTQPSLKEDTVCSQILGLVFGH